MKKLFFALSLLCSHALIFSAQEAEQAPQLQIEDITPEHFAKILHGLVERYENNDNIVLLCLLKENKTRAARNKATNAIEIYEAVEVDHYRCWSEGEEMILMRDGHTTEYPPSLYNKFPEATFNALQTLYEKQQEERKQSS